MHQKDESRTKIKTKMMNRSMSEAPSQQIIVIVSHPLTVGLVGNRIARYLYYDEKVAAMRFRVDRQNSAIQPQSLGSHGRDRKIGLVGWQL